MNSEAVSALIAKTPSLKTAKPKLEAMEPGAFAVSRHTTARTFRVISIHRAAT